MTRTCIVDDATVLLVGSEPQSAAVVRSALQAGGCEVLVAADADRALDVMRTRQVDAIVMSVGDLTDDLVGALRDLSAREETERVPIVVLAERDDADARLRALEAGAVDVRSGPPEGAALCATLRSLIRLKRSADRAHEELSRTQEQLLLAQKMEDVGRLAGGIAHDFNNLLTAIRYHVAFALEDLPEGSAARQEILGVDEAAKRAAELTRQLLAFGRRQVLVPRVVDLNELVAQMGSLLGRLVGARVRLDTELDPHAGKVKADPGQLEQVITNLVVNARDAITGDGRITLRTRPIQEEDDGEEWSVLSVVDTGSGMSDEVRARIFDPFFTTKAEDKGSGLGLSTVYGIVKQSRGDIQVQSEPGQGSAFHVRFPRVDGPAWKRPRTDNPPDRAGRRETVLLVEDDEKVRRAAARVLASRGYTVLEADGGAGAIRLSQGPGPSIDILVSDLVMPGMSGAELARQLRRNKPDLAVLLMSGYTNSEEALEEAAAWPFLAKPFSPDALARMVREALDQPRPDA